MSRPLQERWAVLRTQPRRELVAAQSIRARDVESYAPFRRLRRGNNREAPLFPGYVFARVAPGSDDLLRIRAAPGVAYVLPRTGPPALLPECLVDELRARLADPAGGLAPRPFSPGDRVSVVGGPFRWSDGLFDRHVNASGRVRILLDMVSRTVTVDLKEEWLEHAT